MSFVFNPNVKVLAEKFSVVVKNDALDSPALVTFKYHGKDRVLRPEKVSDHRIGGWVLSENSDGEPAETLVAQEDAPYKMFSFHKMDEVAIFEDEA